jgi:hypothetical protein
MQSAPIKQIYQVFNDEQKNGKWENSGQLHNSVKSY